MGIKSLNFRIFDLILSFNKRFNVKVVLENTSDFTALLLVLRAFFVDLRFIIENIRILDYE